MKYLQSPEREEQKGRVEDGPLGPKGKFKEWPGLGNHIGHITKGVKTAGKAKSSMKTSSKSAPGKASVGKSAGKSGGLAGGSKGASAPKGK